MNESIITDKIIIQKKKENIKLKNFECGVNNIDNNNDNNNNKLYICIAGIIASGKTTLAKVLSKVMNLPVYLENAQNNPYLKDFYESKTKKYGFNLQISLLKDRYNQQQKIIWLSKGAVQDRTIYEDSVFCKMLYDNGNIEKRDYNTYVELFNIMKNFLRRPDLIIYLDISPEESMKRLKLRNRNIENSVPLSYLKNLHSC